MDEHIYILCMILGDKKIIIYSNAQKQTPSMLTEYMGEATWMVQEGVSEPHKPEQIRLHYLFSQNWEMMS
mgnify:CR=1 FL=1